MKKKLTLLLMLACFALKAQEKIGIAFIPITYDSQVNSAQQATRVQESILNDFVAAKKFTVVDREKLEEIAKEKKLQRSESFMDTDQTVVDGISKGATYLVSTNLLNVEQQETKNGWTTSLQVQIKVLDVSTGEILATQNISSALPTLTPLQTTAREKSFTKKQIKEIQKRHQDLDSPQSSAQSSFQSALERLGENVQLFCDANFPLTLEIANWNDRFNFIVASGSDLGIYPGQLLDIMQTTDIQIGERQLQRNQKIATACIVNADDPQFAEAIILETQKEYKKAMQSNVPLKIITK